MESKEAVYAAIFSIPEGKVSTYGRVAAAAGYPNAARMVGRFLRDLPKDSKLPWHRVLRADGKLAFEVNSPSFLRQKQKLETEQVYMHNNKVPLKTYLY